MRIRSPSDKLHGGFRQALGIRLLLGALGAFWAGPALAHVSEQGFVLLLPTGAYIVSGVAAVALTIGVLSLLPARLTTALFAGRRSFAMRGQRHATVVSLGSLGFLAWLVVVGFTGTADPLANPLPLFVWTLWWVAFVMAQGVFGNLWAWVNPWTGLYRMLRGDLDAPPLFTLPARVGSWPGLAGFLAFAAFYLADLAPADPARLAVVATAYWLYTFAAMALFGAQDWLARGEVFTMLLRLYARLSPFRRQGGAFAIGLPGWRAVTAPALPVSAAVLPLALLATGSFDGLNETFWWMAVIDINPLAFPGRSAVVGENLAGLLAANIFLVIVFSGTVWAGLAFIGEPDRFIESFGRQALAILPIALGYHGAHYLTVLMVNAQYALAAASDPWTTGADYLGLGTFYVTTGFFNSAGTVRAIWLTQAGLIVAGHIMAIAMSHAIAADMFGTSSRAARSQLPLAAFMVLYTLFGLWLLASPRGA